jgi:very-short-patch-repair endonuclease
MRNRLKLQWAFMSEAQGWARENGIDTQKMWRAAAKEGIIPPEIPSAPDRCYSEWKSWDAFLDNGNSKNREWWPIEKATAWLRANGIATEEMWRLARAAKLIPKSIPSSPKLAYGLKFKGWPAFLGRNIRGGSSFIEHVLRIEVSQFIPIDFGLSRVVTSDGKTRRVDIVSSALKLIIEYDGWFWHKATTSKDRKVTEALEVSGWRLVRVREAPLVPIGKDDLVVSRKANMFDKSVALLRHLSDLGLIDSDALTNYTLGKQLHSAAHPDLLSTRWRAFGLALIWSRSLHLSTEADWTEYKRTHQLPADIPANPQLVYQLYWRGWTHWVRGESRELQMPIF